MIQSATELMKNKNNKALYRNIYNQEIIKLFIEINLTEIFQFYNDTQPMKS